MKDEKTVAPFPVHPSSLILHPFRFLAVIVRLGTESAIVAVNERKVRVGDLLTEIT
jgi:hypothetical protein